MSGCHANGHVTLQHHQPITSDVDTAAIHHVIIIVSVDTRLMWTRLDCPLRVIIYHLSCCWIYPRVVVSWCSILSNWTAHLVTRCNCGLVGRLNDYVQRPLCTQTRIISKGKGDGYSVNKKTYPIRCSSSLNRSGNQQLPENGHYTTLPLPGKEQLPPGSTKDWLTWKTLSRLRSGAGRSRSYMSSCGYTSDTMCECGQSEQTVQHMLQCHSLFTVHYLQWHMPPFMRQCWGLQCHSVNYWTDPAAYKIWLMQRRQLRCVSTGGRRRSEENATDDGLQKKKQLWIVTYHEETIFTAIEM